MSAISVTDLGKRYRIYGGPRDRFRHLLLGRGGEASEYWALRNVSFEVERGEAVGVIGRNGSGKSTLLQLIAGTLEPSAGQASTNGRLTALLELGAGFDPRFTGRENVFLNAAILGFSEKETARRYAEIAAFADIGPHIDQPVK